MGAAILTWLASQGASLLLGAVAQIVSASIKSFVDAQTQRQIGQVTAERDQALAANKAKDAELVALKNAPKDVDEAAARLEGGTA